MTVFVTAPTLGVMRILPTLLAALIVAAAAAAPAAAGTPMRLYGIGVDWDPNGNLWHVKDKLCNKSDADTGTVLYEFQLFPGEIRDGNPIRIGGVKLRQPIPPHKCVQHRDMPVRVATKKVPPGEYKIALWIGDWNGSTFDGGVKYVLPNTFVRSNGP